MGIPRVWSSKEVIVSSVYVCIVWDMQARESPPASISVYNFPPSPSFLPLRRVRISKRFLTTSRAPEDWQWRGSCGSDCIYVWTAFNLYCLGFRRHLRLMFFISLGKFLDIIFSNSISAPFLPHLLWEICYAFVSTT